MPTIKSLVCSCLPNNAGFLKPATSPEKNVLHWSAGHFSSFAGRRLQTSNEVYRQATIVH